MAALSALLAFAACGAAHAQDVVVVAAHASTITDRPGGLGTVFPAVSVPVTIEVHDTVTQVSIRVGDHVIKGQPLFNLDPLPLQQAAAQTAVRLGEAQASLTKLEGDLVLAQSRGLPTVPGITAQLQAAQAQVALDQQLLDIAKGRGVSVTSPIEGDVSTVNVAPGEDVGPGKPMAVLVDFSRILVTANLPITEQPKVTVGAVAQLTFPTIPDLSVTGTVSTISPGATQNGLSFVVNIDAANTPDKRVRPNIQAYVRVSVARQAAVVVPRAAVASIDQDPTVLLVVAQVARRVRVELGVSDEKNVEILSGLNVGDEVVLVGAQSLSDGSPIRITRVETGT